MAGGQINGLVVRRGQKAEGVVAERGREIAHEGGMVCILEETGYTERGLGGEKGLRREWPPYGALGGFIDAIIRIFHRGESGK